MVACLQTYHVVPDRVPFSYEARKLLRGRSTLIVMQRGKATCTSQSVNQWSGQLLQGIAEWTGTSSAALTTGPWIKALIHAHQIQKDALVIGKLREEDGRGGGGGGWEGVQSNCIRQAGCLRPLLPQQPHTGVRCGVATFWAD